MFEAEGSEAGGHGRFRGPILVARDLWASPGPGFNLQGIDLEVRQGELVALLGPNGSGKSTLLRALAGLVRPERGRVLCGGNDVASLSRRAIARRVALLPQRVRCDFAFTVEQVVEMGREPHLRRLQPYGPADRAAVEAAMTRTGVGPLRQRLITALSGGEQQRAFLAQCLAQQPQALLLDEPTASLDIRYQYDVLTCLQGLAREGHAVVCALHDLDLALRFADRAAVLDRGRLIACGLPAEALTPEVLRQVFGVIAAVERLESGESLLRIQRAV